MKRTWLASPLLLVGCVAPGPDQTRAVDVQHRPTPEQSFFDWTDVAFQTRSLQERRARLAERLRDSGGGVYLAPSLRGRSGGGTFRQLDDFFYFTGLELPDSILAVDGDEGTITLFVPERDARFDSDSRPNDFPGRPLASDPEVSHRSGVSDVRPFDAFGPALEQWVAEGRLLRLDPGRGTMTPEPTWSPLSHEEALIDYVARAHPTARTASARDEVAYLRMKKSPEEVARIRRACQITAQGIRASARFVRGGVDERTLEGELEAEFKRRGAQRLAFDSIIKSGPNSLWPWRILAAHYDRRNRVMRDGELVIYDVGCELDHYASDVGRTFPVSGRFTPEQRRLILMVNTAVDTALAAIRPGVTFAELTDVVLDAVPESERQYMQTGLFFGHHIGLDVGDPSLPDAPLEPGMIFTVEPWYYDHDRNVAVFREEVVLVTKNGAENLTRALPSEPRELERMTGTD